MTDSGKPMGPGSRIIRERAMAVLRETRAKIDPHLLAAMKEKLSAVMASQPGQDTSKPLPPIPQQPADSANALKEVVTAKPPVKVNPAVAARSYKQAEEKAVYPPKFHEAPSDRSEPVDRQKIAQIVLQYMKNREEKQKH